MLLSYRDARWSKQGYSHFRSRRSVHSMRVEPTPEGTKMALDQKVHGA